MKKQISITLEDYRAYKHYPMFNNSKCYFKVIKATNTLDAVIDLCVDEQKIEYWIDLGYNIVLIPKKDNK